MTDLTIYQAEVQGRADALTAASPESLVREVGIAANVIELRGGTIDRTILDVELQRIADDVTGSSTNAELIATGAALEVPAALAGGGYTPSYGAVMPFAENGINFTDANGLEWLKTGYLSFDLGSYPNAVKAMLPNTTFSLQTTPATNYVGSTYSEAFGKFFASSSGKLAESTDGVSWSDQTMASVTVSDFAHLPSGRCIAVLSGNGTYRYTTDGASWSTGASSTGLSKVVATKGGYWYGCHLSQTAWALEGGTTTSVAVASGTSWSDIAYSPSLNRLVMVGTNLCQTNDAAYAGSWTIRTIPAGAYTAVEWVEDFGLFVAVGGAGVWATSPDGINWTAGAVFLSATYTVLIYCTEMRALYALASSGVAAFTRDGRAWVSASGVFTGDAGGGAWGGSAAKGFIISSSAGIFKSTPTPAVGAGQKSSAAPGVPNYVRIK